MGKLTGYILGVLSVFALSYYVLSQDYSYLTGWLGPLFGTNLVMLLSLLYLLLGNIFNRPVVLLSWIIIGVIVGIGARKGTKAIGSATLIYSTTWSFVIISALGMASAIYGGSLLNPTINTSTGLSLNLPPLPPGATLSAIFSEPLLERILPILAQLGGLTSFAGLPLSSTSAYATNIPGALLSNLVYTFVPYLLLNFAIFLAVSGVVGRLMNKALMPKKRTGTDTIETPADPKKTSTRQVKRVNRRWLSRYSALHALIVVLAVAALLVSGFSSASSETGSTPSHLLQSAQSSSEAFSAVNATLSSLGSVVSSLNSTQTINSLNSISFGAGILGDYGNIYNAYVFVNKTSNSLQTFLNHGSPSVPILTLVAISDNSSILFNALAHDGVLGSQVVSQLKSYNFYNLIPQTVIIDAFQGNLKQTSTEALNAATNISMSLGATGLNEIIGIPLSVASSQVFGNTNLSLYLFGAASPVYNAETSIATAAGSGFANGGMYTPFESGIGSGYLKPGQEKYPAQASIFIAGSLNVADLGSYLGNFTSLLKNSSGFFNNTQNIEFLGGIFVHTNAVHSSSSHHQFSASDIFGYSGNITFGNNQTVYAMSIQYPDRNISNPSTGTQHFTKVYSTLPGFSGTSASTNETVYPFGSVLNLNNISFSSNATFPAAINITQSFVNEGSNTYQVNITVRNNDTDLISNVTVLGNRYIQSYSGLSVTSGNLSGTQATLSTNASIELTYSLHLTGVGSYIISAPQVNYTMNGTTFSINGAEIVVSAVMPSMFHAVNHALFTEISQVATNPDLSFLTVIIAPGFYVFDLFILLVFGIDIYLEYRAFIRWRALRREFK